MYYTPEEKREYWKKMDRMYLEPTLDTLRQILDENYCMTTNEIIQFIQNNKYSYYIKLDEYKYNGEIRTASLKGTITKSLNILLEDSEVIKDTKGRWYSIFNVSILNNKIVPSKKWIYSECKKNGIVDKIKKIYSDELGNEPSLEQFGLLEVERVYEYQVSAAKERFQQHAAKKPLIFGLRKWNGDYEKLLEEYNILKKQYNTYHIQFENYDNALKLYNEKLEKLCFETLEKNKNNRLQDKTFWYNLNGFEFENQISNLLIKKGFEVEHTKYSGDGGVDIILKQEKFRIAVQCKAFKHLIGPNIVREIAGVVKRDHYDLGIIFGLEGFTDGAKKEANELCVKLYDLNDIINLQKGQMKINLIQKDISRRSMLMAPEENNNLSTRITTANWTKVQSSNINFISYDDNLKILSIIFKSDSNTAYCYADISQIEYTNFINSNSLGRYLREYIIPQKKCTQIKV